jgi:hypothetical protein
MITIDLKAPKCWEELTDNQLRYVFGLIAQGLTAPELKTYCLIHWSGMQVMHKYGKGWMCKFADDEFVVTAEQVNAAIGSLNWLDEVPVMPVRIEKIGKHRALPANFQDVPFETFIICDNLYQGYLSTKNEKLLEYMAAQLYESNDLKLTDAERLNVFYWFASLKAYLAHEFSHLFSPIFTIDREDNMFKPRIEKYNLLKDAVNAQIRALTKGDVTKEKEVLAIDTWRAFTELDALAKEYDEFSQKYPSK